LAVRAWVGIAGRQCRPPAGRCQSKIPETSTITGLDLNEGMLEVAWRLPLLSGLIDWRQGSSLAVPFADGIFESGSGSRDCNSSRSAEGARRGAPRPGIRGPVTLSVWTGHLRTSSRCGKAWRDKLSTDAAVSGAAAFWLADADELRGLLQGEGFRDVVIHHVRMTLWFPPPEEFVQDVRQRRRGPPRRDGDQPAEGVPDAPARPPPRPPCHRVGAPEEECGPPLPLPRARPAEQQPRSPGGWPALRRADECEHALHGFTNGDLRAKLAGTSFPLHHDAARQSAQTTRLLHRLHLYGVADGGSPLSATASWALR
jgi:hypothetical protein